MSSLLPWPVSEISRELGAARHGASVQFGLLAVSCGTEAALGNAPRPLKAPFACGLLCAKVDDWAANDFTGAANAPGADSSNKDRNTTFLIVGLHINAGLESRGADEPAETPDTNPVSLNTREVAVRCIQG